MNLDTNLTKGVDFAAARQAVNLNVLRRHDANILDILDSSSHVVVYDFDMSSQSWAKRGIEGTMFLFRRSVEPHYGLMIMNRLGIENLMILLTPHMEVQLLGEYVIYRKPDDSVQGLWMYETVDRTRLASELSRCVQLFVLCL
ncbi:hypothetical protein BC832DRAFT_531893 [Gaertneriomyces semiglobifer]|nr:hypothetical protein BC832DRAFT_531893 [Gaertneriomyces semiglobifer]